MTDLAVWLLGGGLLLIGLTITGGNLVALYRLRPDQRASALDRSTEQTIRQIQARYRAASIVAIRRWSARPSMLPLRHPPRRPTTANAVSADPDFEQDGPWHD